MPISRFVKGHLADALAKSGLRLTTRRSSLRAQRLFVGAHGNDSIVPVDRRAPLPVATTSAVGWRTVGLPVTVAAVAAMAIYVALPTTPAEIYFQVISWGCIALFVSGLVRHGSLSTPWALVAIGWASFAAGDMLYTIFEFVLDTDPFPSPADIFYLAAYPFFAAGLAGLVHRSRPDGDRVAMIDASIMLVPAAVAAWMFIIDPFASDSTSSSVERSVMAAYPLGDLLLLAVLLRLFAGTAVHRRAAQPAMGLLGLALVGLLVADVLFELGELYDTYALGGWRESLFLAPYILIAGCGNDASVRNVGVLLPRTDPSLGRRRLALLTTAALITPALLVVQWLRSDDVQVLLVVGATAITFLLVIARMVALVGALESSRADLAHDANHDQLTGLPNRRMFAREIDAVLEQRLAGSLLFIDLDNFKNVNDTSGHLAGDHVLIEVSHRLRAAMRADDVVARIAGDEFAVLLPRTDAEAARSLCERLLDELHLPSGNDIPVTASIGVVTWSDVDRPTSVEGLLVEADRAMYQAKARDGNGMVAARH